jgi:hypothetical protein
MSNGWISRLVVSGPSEEVQTFAKTATDPEILSRQGRTPWEGERHLGLSFTALAGVLTPSRRARFKDQPEEPWELCVEALGHLGPGVAQHTYRFETGWEPDRLLVELSSELPRLCFVLGSVDPASDTQESLFIHRGHLQRYRLSNKLKEAFYARIPEDASESETLQAEWEADWAMLDAVMIHWDRKVAATTRRSRPATRLRPSRTRATRKQGKKR